MFDPPALPQPKLVNNWPPSDDVEKTKYVKIKFVYSEIPEGRGSTPEPKEGWGRRYRRVAPPNAASKTSSSSATPAPAQAAESVGAAPAPAPDAATSPAAPAAAAPIAPPDASAPTVDTAATTAASASAAPHVASAAAPSPAPTPAAAPAAPATAPALAALPAAAAASSPALAAKGSAEKVEKSSKHVPKKVQQLDSVLKMWAEVEVFTVNDWWNARIEEILMESSKSAKVSVKYEHDPNVYANAEGDETEFAIRQTDGIWAYGDKIRAREDPTLDSQLPPTIPPVLAPALVAPAPAATVAVSAAQAVPADTPSPAPAAPPVKRELAMVSGGAAGAAGASVSLVECLHKGLNSPACVAAPLVKDEMLEEKDHYFEGHPCYWPLYWARTKDAKLTFTKVKPFPHTYKRVRVSFGKEGESSAPRSSWMRDLDKECEDRRRAGLASPLLEYDSNKSSPVLGSPPASSAPPVLSHNPAVQPSSGTVLVAPQVVRANSSSTAAPNAESAATTDDPSAQDRATSVSPVVSEEAVAEWRLKAIHALALEDLTKAELKIKIKGKVPKAIFKQLLAELAVKTDASTDKDKVKYKLNAASWPQVQIDKWSEYTDDDRVVLRLRMSRASDGASTKASAARSSADSRGSRSPANTEARADDDPKGKREDGAGDTGNRGGALRAGGSEGSAFKDVKAGQRAGSSIVVPPRPKGDSLQDKTITSSSTSTGKKKSSTSPVGQEAGNAKSRDADVPRKRQREGSAEPSDRESKQARKAESPSIKPPSDVAAPSPSDRDKDKDRDRDRDRGRDADRERDTPKVRTDSSISPGHSFSPLLFLFCFFFTAAAASAAAVLMLMVYQRELGACCSELAFMCTPRWSRSKPKLEKRKERQRGRQRKKRQRRLGIGGRAAAQG